MYKYNSISLEKKLCEINFFIFCVLFLWPFLGRREISRPLLHWKSQIQKLMSLNAERESLMIDINDGCDAFDGHIETKTLPKLPLKSILRFKCVCKFFRALISTPEFVHCLSSYSNRLLILISLNL